MNFYLWLGNSPLHVKRRQSILYSYEVMLAEGMPTKDAIELLAHGFDLWRWVTKRIIREEIAADPIGHVKRVDEERQRLARVCPKSFKRK